MSELMTVREMRGHVETALADDDLLTLIRAAQDDLDEWAPPMAEDDTHAIAELTETVHARGKTLARLTYRPDSVTNVTDITGTGETDLDEDDDYRIRDDCLERVSGYHWGDRTVVIYIPRSDFARRRRALIALVKLAINDEPGVGSEMAGPWSKSSAGKSTRAERDRILRDYREPDLFA